MNTALSHTLWAVLVVIALALSFFLFPKPVIAVGTAADAMCIASWDYSCPCGMVCKKGGPPGGQGCPCQDTTNSFTTPGKCVAAIKCLATGAPGQNGGMGDLKQALDMAKSLLDMMKGKGGGGGGDSGGGAATGATNPTLGGCAQYYNVTLPSSDPCAVYVPPVSTSLASTSGSAATDLISSLLNGAYSTGDSTSGTTNTTSNTQVAATTTSTGVVQQTTTGTAPAGVMAQTPGVSGDIRYSSSTVTVLVNNVDQKSGTQVAGFYGTDAAGQPTGVISSMCQGRPWASNFLSFIIPSSFFDSLCELRGYKVGTVVASAPATHVTTKPKVVKPAATTTAATAEPVGPYVDPQADIWAVPASVPLGARTTVFWNAKGVTSCTETSPDGSFSQSSLSGGAATVPLSGPTTYTISCLTPKGEHITNYVTVTLGSN